MRTSFDWSRFYDYLIARKNILTNSLSNWVVFVEAYLEKYASRNKFESKCPGSASYRAFVHAHKLCETKSEIFTLRHMHSWVIQTPNV